MFFLSKELQRDELSCTDVEYDIKRTKQSISMIDNDKLCNEAKTYSEKIVIPLNLELELPIHVTRSTAANSAHTYTHHTYTYTYTYIHAVQEIHTYNNCVITKLSKLS